MEPTGRFVLAKQGVGPEPRGDEGGSTDVTTTNGASSVDFHARRTTLYTDVLGNRMPDVF